jgi:hypothetical protein
MFPTLLLHSKNRIRKNAIRMNKLTIWQRNLNQYDQYMRKMLAIKELGDVPRWKLFMTDINIKWKYETCEYTKEVKEDLSRAHMIITLPPINNVTVK